MATKTTVRTFCDFCNPKCLPHGSGWLDECDEESAIQNFDWVMVEGKLMCVDCQFPLTEKLKRYGIELREKHNLYRLKR